MKTSLGADRCSNILQDISQDSQKPQLNLFPLDQEPTSPISTCGKLSQISVSRIPPDHKKETTPTNKTKEPDDIIEKYNEETKFETSQQPLSNKEIEQISKNGGLKFFKFLTLFGLILAIGIAIMSNFNVNSFELYKISQNNSILKSKEQTIALSVSQSIIRQIINDKSSVNIVKEKAHIEQFYSEEYNQDLWNEILRIIKEDRRISIEEGFWIEKQYK